MAVNPYPYVFIYNEEWVHWLSANSCGMFSAPSLGLNHVLEMMSKFGGKKCIMIPVDDGRWQAIKYALRFKMHMHHSLK